MMAIMAMMKDHDNYNDNDRHGNRSTSSNNSSRSGSSSKSDDGDNRYLDAVRIRGSSWKVTNMGRTAKKKASKYCHLKNVFAQADKIPPQIPMVILTREACFKQI